MKPLIEGQKPKQDQEIHVSQSFAKEKLAPETRNSVNYKSNQEPGPREGFHKSETQNLDRKKTSSMTPKSAYKRAQSGYKLDRNKSEQQTE